MIISGPFLPILIVGFVFSINMFVYELRNKRDIEFKTIIKIINETHYIRKLIRRLNSFIIIINKGEKKSIIVTPRFSYFILINRFIYKYIIKYNIRY